MCKFGIDVKIPKFGLGGKKHEGEVDVDIDAKGKIKKPSVDAKGKLDVDINVDAKGKIKQPDVYIDIDPKGNLKRKNPVLILMLMLKCPKLDLEKEKNTKKSEETRRTC